VTKGELWIEKRKKDRLDLSFPVVYHLVKSASTKQELKARGRNMSQGGIRLVTKERMDLGATIYVKIVLPDSLEPVTGTAEVVWCEEKDSEGKKEQHAGLRFIELESKGQDLVTRFMTENIKKMSGL
jgi:c-di-GMP-binding flagellar brake protein YcgR